MCERERERERESNTTNSTTNKRNKKRRVGGVQDANDGKRGRKDIWPGVRRGECVSWVRRREREQRERRGKRATTDQKLQPESQSG